MKGDTGKEVNKTSNDNIAITFTKDRLQKFDINFDGDKLEVMSYSDGKIQTIEYYRDEKLCPNTSKDKQGFGFCGQCGQFHNKKM